MSIPYTNECVWQTDEAENIWAKQLNCGFVLVKQSDASVVEML